MISEMLFSLNDIDIDSMTYDKSDTETDTPCLGIRRAFFASLSTMFDTGMQLGTQLGITGHLSLLMTLIPTILVLTTWTSLWDSPHSPMLH